MVSESSILWVKYGKFLSLPANCELYFSIISIFLSIFAVLPAIVHGSFVQTDAFALFFGGTSLLIMVGVILDTVQQINTYLLNHHYDGLMQSKLSRSSNY